MMSAAERPIVTSVIYSSKLWHFITYRERIFPLSRLHIDIFSKYVCFANYVVVRGESYDEKSEIVDVRLVKTVFNAKSQ